MKERGKFQVHWKSCSPNFHPNSNMPCLSTNSIHLLYHTSVKVIRIFSAAKPKLYFARNINRPLPISSRSPIYSALLAIMSLLCTVTLWPLLTSDDFHYNVLRHHFFFLLPTSYGHVPNKSLASIMFKQSHDTLHNLYHDAETIRIHVEHLAVLSCFLYLSGTTPFCYTVGFSDLQSLITILSVSLLQPRFLLHPFTSTLLICFHGMHTDTFTLRLPASKQLSWSHSSEFSLTYLWRRRISLLFCRFIKGSDLKIQSWTFFSLKNCITSISCTNWFWWRKHIRN